MTDFERDELGAHPEWSRILAVYCERQALVRGQNAESEDWVDRALHVDGVAADRLSRVHGRLIALGFLRFQITDRALGLQYQVSPDGRRELARLSGSIEPDDTESDPDDAETEAPVDNGVWDN